MSLSLEKSRLRGLDNINQSLGTIITIKNVALTTVPSFAFPHFYYMPHTTNTVTVLWHSH
jgi:hypothetical protein